MKLSADQLAYGVDLAKNFGFKWDACPRTSSQFSIHYPGDAPFSENESKFIRDVLHKYKDKTKVYISIRMDGHSILYPFSYANVKLNNELQVQKFAYEITNKVNLRAGMIRAFINDSLYNMNGKPRCGHSVDYAYDLGIPYSFEMRVFLGRTTGILTKFQALPPGYHSQLLLGYLSGLKRVYDLVMTESNPKALALLHI